MESENVLVKVLVVRFSSMGDILLTTPVLRAIHDVMEGEVELHFLTKKAFAPLVEGLESVQVVHTIERATTEVEPALKAVGFHYVVDLHSSARSGFVRRALVRDGALAFRVDKRNFSKLKLVRGGTNDLAGEHIVDRYAKCLAAFGTVALGGLELPALPAVEVRAGRELLAGGFVAIAVGAAHEGKTVPVGHWVEVVRALTAAGSEVVLLGGPDDRPAAGLVELEESGVLNLVGELSLLESFAVLAAARVLVVGDTGLMHAGAAAGVPMVVVWGCTAPALGMAPYKAHLQTIELEPEGRRMVEGVRRPCSKLGNRCRYKTPCIETVSAERISAAIFGLLS